MQEHVCNVNNYIYLEIKMTTLEYKVDYGNTIVLECVLIGIPHPESISWHRRRQDNTVTDISIDNSKYMGSTLINPSLIVVNVNENDSGSYFCTVAIVGIKSVITGEIVSLHIKGM